jgi:dephospho-CoA kinase
VNVGRDSRKPVIGLLGGVGAGKSTVAAELVKLGCVLVDADAIGHELLEDPEVQAELRRLWGDGVVDSAGRVDRPAVARIVFNSLEDLAALNRVMHPRMRRRMAERIEAASYDPAIPAVAVDAALLLETDWHELCTVFVYVSAPAELRAQRVERDRGWDRATWKQRENSQKPLDMKADRAEYDIDGSSSLSCLREQVRSVFQKMVNPADRP